MREFFCLFLISISSSGAAGFSSAAKNDQSYIHSIAYPDSLRERQHLYNGVLWKHNFRRIAGDPYLFTNVFLPGMITYNGKTFVNVKLRYDIYSDEVMIPRDLEQIVQLNREMVDSFTLVFDNGFYRFVNIVPDGSGLPEGYANILYKGKSELYVKFTKNIFTQVTDQSDGEFYHFSTIYFVNEGRAFQIASLRDICRILNEDKERIRKYVRENRLKVTRKLPESFIPVIRYYDSIKN